MRVFPIILTKSVAATSRVAFRQFFDNSFYLYYCVAAFALYVAGMLRLTDHFLAKNIAGYDFSGSYTIGMAVFFCAAIIYLHLARWRRWLNWRYYVLGSVVVFFPLVFFASSLKIILNPNAAIVTALNEQYCDLQIADVICGQSFAALVTSMSLRAFPVVLTIPVMFWYFVIRPGISGEQPA